MTGLIMVQNICQIWRPYSSKMAAAAPYVLPATRHAARYVWRNRRWITDRALRLSHEVRQWRGINSNRRRTR